MSKAIHSPSYSLWSWIVAVLLVLLLIWAWLVGYGPSRNCCGATTMAAPVASAAATAAAVSSALNVNWSADGKVTLSGIASSEDVKKTWLEAAKRNFGEGNVVDQITVNASASGTPSITLQGEVDSEQTKQQRQEKAVAAFTGATINNQLRVAAPAPVAAKAEPDCTAALAVAATFKVGSAELTNESKQKLKGATACIKQPALITGHTDNVGKEQSNLALSERRAKAVVEYLKSQGVAANLLQSKGMGQSAPVADNSTAEGRAKNRRIEFSKP